VATPDSASPEEFFVAGGTLRADAPSYIPRQADEDLYAALSHGEFCYVLTSRQMGKSSLMARTAQRLREDGATPVVLDLTAIGLNLTPEQWYEGLLSRFGRAVDLEDELEDFWFDHEHRGPMQRWVDAIEQVVFPRTDGRIVVFVDEIDIVQSLPFSTNEFFAGVRECYTRRAEDPAFERLSFCLIGVATPSDLIDDARVTPFNVGRRVDLLDFTEAEALTLGNGLGRDDAISSVLMSRVVHWTGGHPYLTQRLGQAVAFDMSVTDADGVDALCAEMFFSERAQEQDSNLQFVRNIMRSEHVDSAAALARYRDARAGKAVPHDETDPSVNALQLSGIAHAVDGHMRVRNRIYERVFDARWVSENMPDAELRRQRAAYRRGILRTGGIAATVLVVVTVLAIQAMRQTTKAQSVERQALEDTAQSQIEQGVRMLEDGNDLGLAYLVEARRNAPEGSPLRGSAERLWASWHAPYEDRLDLVMNIQRPVSVQFSPDGQILAVASVSGQIHLRDAMTGVPKRGPLTVGVEATAMSFSPAGERLAVGDRNGRIHVWDTNTWAAIRADVGHEHRVRGLEFSRSGERLASASAQGTVKVWETTTWKLVSQPSLGAYEPRTVSISPSGNAVALAASRTVEVWDADTGARLHIVEYGDQHASTARFTPDGKRLVTCANGKPIAIWDTETWRQMESTLATPVLAFSLGPTGGRICITGDDDLVSVWDIATGELVGRPYWHPELGVAAFDPMRPRLAVYSTEQNRVLAWKIPAATPDRSSLTSLRTTVFGASAAFSPDGKVAAVGDQGILHLFNTTTWQPLRPPLLHNAEVWGMQFSSDSQHLLSASTGAGLVHLWHVETGTEEWPPRVVSSQTTDVAFHADGSLIAASSNVAAHVWDRETGEMIGEPLGAPYVWGIAFSPVEHVLAVCGAGGVDLWDIDTGTQVGYLPTDAGDSAYEAAFTSDGRRLIVASATPHVVVWDVETLSRAGTPVTVPTASWGISVDAAARQLLVTDPFEGVARVWDINTRLPSGPATPVGFRLARASMSPDARAYITPTAQGFDLYRLPAPPAGLGAMRAHTRASVGYYLTEHGEPARVNEGEWRQARGTIAPRPGVHAAPVRGLLSPGRGVVIAYINSSHQTVSEDDGATWITEPTSVHPDEVMAIRDGVFAMDPTGRKAVSAHRRGQGDFFSVLGASTAVVGNDLVLRGAWGSYWGSADQGAKWTAETPSNQMVALHTVLGVGSTLYGVADPTPHQVYRRGHASAIPAWRALVVHQRGGSQSGGWSKEELSTVAGFPTSDAASAPDRRWKTVHVDDGLVQATDLMDVDGPRVEAAVYLATIIHSTEGRGARLFVEARDAGSVWLNGERLPQGPDWRLSRWYSPMALRRPYPVQLQAGPNVLLVEVGGDNARWAMAHFDDARGLTCATDPSATGVPLTHQEPLWVPIADRPSDPKITVIGAVGDGLYAGTSGHGILRFNESGEGWDELNRGLPANEYIFVYGLLTLGDTLYAATSHGVYRWRPNVERWDPRNGALTDFYATAIAASDDWMYAGTWEGRIYRSPDRGETWEQVYGSSTNSDAVALR